MTLQQCKDQVARNHGKESWQKWRLNYDFFPQKYHDEAAELYARSKADKFEKALNEIRGHTYARDTDDAILHEIKKTLNEAGFPYENED